MMLEARVGRNGLKLDLIAAAVHDDGAACKLANGYEHGGVLAKGAVVPLKREVLLCRNHDVGVIVGNSKSAPVVRFALQDLSDRIRAMVARIRVRVEDGQSSHLPSQELAHPWQAVQGQADPQQVLAK